MTLSIPEVKRKCKLFGVVEYAHRSIFRTELSPDHFSRNFFRYSICCLSLVSIGPSFAEALFFHIRTLPSSEADKTKSAVGV